MCVTREPLTDASLPVAQVRGDDQVSLFSHTHVLEALLHARHHLVGSQHDVVRLSIVVPGIRTYTEALCH